MAKGGIKRAQDTDVEKDALAEVEISDADAEKLMKIQADIQKTEVILGAFGPHTL